MFWEGLAIHNNPNAILGPAGKAIALDDLPPPNTERWVIRRKAEVVAAVRAGLLSFDEACARYRLSNEEFRSWQRLFKEHGLRGLRTTRLKQYRRMDHARSLGPWRGGMATSSEAGAARTERETR